MQERGAFTFVLSGGSLLKALGHLVGSPGVDFSKWHVFFVDERNVPHSHADSNFKGADEAFLSKVRLLCSTGRKFPQLHTISRMLCMPWHRHGTLHAAMRPLWGNVLQ
jgi:6-phosphogluconolactonase